MRVTRMGIAIGVKEKKGVEILGMGERECGCEE